MLDQIDALSTALPEWEPGKVADPVQRVRNLLYVAAVPDVLEAEILESYVPLVVFDQIKQDISKDDLIRILYWIATHPSGGEDRAARQLRPLGLENAPADMDTVARTRDHLRAETAGPADRQNTSEVNAASLCEGLNQCENHGMRMAAIFSILARRKLESGIASK